MYFIAIVAVPVLIIALIKNNLILAIISLTLIVWSGLRFIYEELSDLIKALGSQQGELEERIDELDQKINNIKKNKIRTYK